MSWLSSLFGGGGGDNGQAQAIAIYQAGLAAQQRDRDAAAAAAQQAAQQAALDQQQRQFDAVQAANAPTAYDQALQSSQLTDLQNEQTRNTLRNNALAQVGSTFSPDFENTYLPSSYDAPYIASAFQKQRGSVDDYLGNLLKRGVITQAGYQGGESAASEQDPAVRAQLQNVGDTLLAAQRGRLTDIGNRARGAASTVDIGQSFDPSVFSNELAQTSSDIGNQFGDLYSSQVPTGLYDLSNLANKAGAAQGAQNTPFDPAALAGTTQQQEVAPPPKQRSQSVF